MILAFVSAGAARWAGIQSGRVGFFWAGIGLMVAGGLFRRHCFRMLGHHFRPSVRVLPDQPVIEQGAYRWIRHPSYLALILIFSGVGFALTNWFSIGFATFVPVIGCGYRIQVEEKALLETIGAPYRDYMNRTKRLIPFLF